MEFTCFNHDKTNLPVITPLGKEIICHLDNKNDLYIPDYDSVYKDVLSRYHDDFRKEVLHSYEYKIRSGRVNSHNND